MKTTILHKVGHFPCLNGVRGIAILFVICSHLVKSPGVPKPIHDVLSYSYLGIIGVRTFFILSGFLISFVLLKEYRNYGSISIRTFFFKRIIRILPSFYFYLFALYLLDYINIITIDTSVLITSMLFIQNFNVYQVNQCLPYSWITIHSWSLSVEEQFYLTYPFIFKTFNSIGLKKPLIITLILLGTGTFFRAFNYAYPDYSKYILGSFFMHFDYLALGGIIAVLYDRYFTTLYQALDRYKTGVFILSLIVTYIAAEYEFQSGYFAILCGTTMSVSISLLFIMCLLFPHSRIGQILESKLLVYIGTISYSLYIWQQLFLGGTKSWLMFHELAAFPFNILCSFLCGIIAYSLIEKPFQKLKKYLL